MSKDLCGRHNTFATFSEDELWRSTLATSIVISRGRRSTLDVSCCVFSANRIVRAASSGDKVHIAWRAWHFVSAENWRKPRTKHRFFGINCGVHKKTHRKTSILKLHSVKLEEVSHEMLVLMLQRVSSRVSGFLLRSPCLWGSCKTYSFQMFPSRLSCCFARQMLGCATLWHSNLFDNVSKVVLCCRRNTFSEDELQFSYVASAALWRLPSSFCVAGAALQTCRIAFSTLHTLHSTLYTLHYTLYTVDFTLYTLHSTLYIPHSTHDTPDSLPYTSHAKLYTLHSILYTTFYTPHCTLYTPHSTLYTPHSTIYTLHSTLCTPPSSAFHSLQCTGTVTGEKCRLFKWLVLRKHSTWLNSGSWAASFFYISKKYTTFGRLGKSPSSFWTFGSIFVANVWWIITTPLGHGNVRKSMEKFILARKIAWTIHGYPENFP